MFDIYYTPSTRFVAEFMGEVNIINYRTHFIDRNIESSVQFNDEKEFLSFHHKGLKRKEIEIIRPENAIQMIAIQSHYFWKQRTLVSMYC